MSSLLKSLASSVCALAIALAASATKPYSLPSAHKNLAEAQINANLGLESGFSAAAMREAQSNSPFAGLEVSTYTDDYDAQHPTATKMVDYAARFLGTRYRLGASGPKAFDCSGFTSYVYKNFGISLDRSSRSQFLQGEKVAVSNLRPGDLLFFSSRSSGMKNVGHVGMVVSVDPATQTCTFIHASTKKGVTYQRFPDNGYYQRRFLGARRILGTDLDASTDMAAN